MLNIGINLFHTFGCLLFLNVKDKHPEKFETKAALLNGCGQAWQKQKRAGGI